MFEEVLTSIANGKSVVSSFWWCNEIWNRKWPHAETLKGERERGKKSGLWVFSFIGTIIMTAHLHSIYYNDENLYELQCPVFIVRVPMLPPA